MKRLFVFLFAFLMILSVFPVIMPPAEASVYDYSITDIEQTTRDTIVVSAQCLFCSGCNPNDPGWPDRGTGCTPFGCGYPPTSFPSYVNCQHGSPDGRYAAIRLKNNAGTVIQTQKLVCDTSNWPLNTLWSHNFIFSALQFNAGETITIEADFYCSYCYHWYATPKTFVPQKYSFVFIPFHWDASVTVAKPAIVSRTGWGCPEGQSSPRWSPAYSTVTHIIIHHTDSTNSAVDWATEVYNVWNYHANIRDGGWGDIGYHYLIDPNGVIYEGRAGGDDVIAGHVLDHNRGTMGVAFLGTFSSTEPTSSALRSAAALIAWKCAQKNIDPLGSGTDFAGTYYGFIAGHRDLAATECPGSRLWDLLPTLRQSVSNGVTNPLGSSTPKFETGFFAEVKKQKQLIIDSIGTLTDENTEVIPVGENMIFPDHTYWNWLKLPPSWETIQFSETDVDQAQRYMDMHGWSYMVTFATNHGAPIGDRYITITNKEMWNMVDLNVEGWSNWGPTVIAEDSAASSDYTVLHELGHSWGLLDEYRYTTWYNEASSLLWHPHYGYDGYAIWLLTGHPPNSYPEDTLGTDTSNGYLFDSKRCIMGPANPWAPGRGFCPLHQWDDPNRDEWGAPRSYEGCSAHVEETINDDIGVSTAGLVSAIITFYWNQSMRPTIQEITGFPIVGKSMQYPGPSNYSIQVFAEEGELIYNSNISLSFTSAFSQYLPGLHAGITSDFVTIHWLLPMFSETTVTVVLRDNVENQVIETQVVTIVPTAEAWIDCRTTDKTLYDFGETIEVTTEINTTLPSMDVVLDVSLLDPNSIVQDYEAWIGTIYPTADPITLYLNMPSSGIPGTWTVYVAVLNSTGQLQDSKRNLITVGVDAIPPTTTLNIGSPKYTDIGGNVYVTPSTSFDLIATDNLGGSGVASIAYNIRNATYNSGWLPYAASFYLAGLADGSYFIDYNSTDNTGNTEPTNTTTVILENIYAVINLDPHVLNLKSKSQWFTARIEIPANYHVSNYTASDININSLRLNQTIPIDPTAPMAIGDYDENGILDLMVEFNRTTLAEFMRTQGIVTDNVTLTISGELNDGTSFEGSAVIVARMPGDVNMDGKVDLFDAITAANHFGCCQGDTGWNSVVDEDENGLIDIFDLILIARNFGKL